MSDIEYLGESLPYYNNYEKKITEDDDSSERKNKGKEVEFFPNKDVVMTRSPQWTIHNENKIIKYKDENNIKKNILSSSDFKSSPKNIYPLSGVLNYDFNTYIATNQIM